jgi:hypothetical protein
MEDDDGPMTGHSECAGRIGGSGQVIGDDEHLLSDFSR